MEKKFNIPSAINHSCFFNYKDELVHLSETETNYWFALLYLYRKNLLQLNKKQKIFLDEDKKTLNPDYDIFRTQIKLSSFNALGITGNASYKKLERFLLNLTSAKLEVNILGKNKEIISEKIDIFNLIHIDAKNEMNIEFSKKLARSLLHTKSYFMKVDLDILFKINGYKAKRLYLLCKDYYKMPDRQITILKKDLELLIDGIPNTKPFQQVVDNVNYYPKEKEKDEKKKDKEKDEKENNKKATDISITIEELEEEFSLDTYLIKFGKLPKEEVIKKVAKPEKQKDEILLAEAKAETEAWIKLGNIVRDKKAYSDKIYDDKIKAKKKKQQERQEYKDEIEASKPQDVENPEQLIDEILENAKHQLEDEIDIDKGVPMIVFRKSYMSGGIFEYVTDDYHILTSQNANYSDNAQQTYLGITSDAVEYEIYYTETKLDKYLMMYF